MFEEERINWVNGIYEDGEWTSWDLIENYIDDDDSWEPDDEILGESLPPSTLQLWELLAKMIEAAKNYLETTGRHLPIYGELGELYGEIKYGIKRHKPNTPGSDGRMGNDFFEIKTISPMKSSDTVQVKRAGNFNKLLIVRISEEFQFKSKMIERKNLTKGTGKFTKASWNSDDGPNK